MNDDKKDNIILFPLNKIKHKDTAGKPKHDEKLHQKIVEEQTKEFVEGNVDDIAYTLLDKFVNMGIRTNKFTFTGDLALVIDCIRGLIYRDFNKPHPAQMLSDKMVKLNVQGKNKTAQLNYNVFLNTKHKVHKPISKEVSDEIKDLADMGDVQFSPDFNLDDPNGNGKK